MVEMMLLGLQAVTAADYYADGLVVTRGTVHDHVWTFAVGESKGNYYPLYNCPCAF